MARLIRALGILLVFSAIVVYARDCRLSFNQWKYCGESGQSAFLGDWVHFGWSPSGMFTDVLQVDGKPAARLVKYHFRLVDDVLEVSTLDGTKTARYCGK